MSVKAPLVSEIGPVEEALLAGVVSVKAPLVSEIGPVEEALLAGVVAVNAPLVSEAVVWTLPLGTVESVSLGSVSALSGLAGQAFLGAAS